MTPEEAAAAHPTAAAQPRPFLGLRQAVLLIVGVVLGAGIFKAPAVVAALTGSPGWMFAAWALGGLISLAGALCYAELATAYPHPGGDYHFLRRAYGRSVAFLFGWARFSVITTGSIALLAFVFGDYLHQVLPLAVGGVAVGAPVYAVASLLVLWGVNSRGLRTGAFAQSWLTGLEIAGLLVLVAAGLWLVAGSSAIPAVPAPAVAGGTPGLAAFGLAMVFVLLTFGGWNDAAYVSAELEGGPRSMVRALVLAIVLITVLYLLVVWACWRGLGMAGMASSDALAADLTRLAFGPAGETGMALLAALGALASMNATMILGARTQYALAHDWPALARLRVWDGRRGTPANAMHVQNLAALLLVAIGVGTGSGFRAMVEFTAPVFWLFFLLAGFSLVVLRVREPRTPRPFRVPLYPVLPLLFCATCSYMLWSSLSYVYNERLGGLNAAWIGVAVLAAGCVLLLLVRRRSAPPLRLPVAASGQRARGG